MAARVRWLKADQLKRSKVLELENSRPRTAVSDLTLDKLILTEAAKGNFQAPRVFDHVRANLHVSEHRACAALGQHRSTQRKVPRGREDAKQLSADVVELAGQYGRRCLVASGRLVGQ